MEVGRTESNSRNCSFLFSVFVSLPVLGYSGAVLPYGGAFESSQHSGYVFGRYPILSKISVAPKIGSQGLGYLTGIW